MTPQLHVRMAENLLPARSKGLEQVVALFGNMLVQKLHPGAQLAILQNGQALLEVAGGNTFEGGEPVRPDTLFQMRSITKLMATLVALRSLERGRFSLDDPVAAYWPAFGRNGKEGITVRDVMSHRAGIPDGPALAPQQLHDFAQVRLAIEALEPVWPRGKENGYHAHTIGWILQELVQAWEGQAMETLLRGEILEPLGIRDLYLGLPGSEFGRMARMTVEDADQRLKAMVPVSFRASGCDWVHYNVGSRDELVASVEAELARVGAAHAGGSLPESVFGPWWAAFIAERRDQLKKAGISLADEIPAKS